MDRILLPGCQEHGQKRKLGGRGSPGAPGLLLLFMGKPNSVPRLKAPLSFQQ